MAVIERDEFREYMALIREDIAGLGTRLDTLNGRTRDNEQDIAVLKDRAGHGLAAAWGGGIVGVIVGAAEALRWWFGK